jgi:hypothetical protein
MSSNIFQNESLIAKTVLSEFENNLVMARTINRQFEDTFGTNSGVTINIRKPTRYTVTSNADITGDLQAIQQRVVPLTISFRDVVAMSVTSQQLALNLDDFTRECITPAMLQLANKVDSRIYDSSLGIYNYVGAAGTAPNSFAAVNSARTKLTGLGVRTSPRYLMFSVNDGGAVSDGLSTQFNYAKFNQEVLDQGVIGNMAGFDMYEVQNNITSIRSSIPDGTGIGTPVVATTSVSGATSIAISGLTPSTTAIFKKGAVFSIAGVGAVNPVDRNPTGQVMNFVVTADANSSAGGLATIFIAPTIIFDGGPYVNVTALPVAGAALTVQGSHTLNVAYHPEAFTMAMIKLPEFTESGAYMKTMVDTKSKISIRMTKQYQIMPDLLVVRFEVLYGIACFPEYATRLMGSYQTV